MKFEFCLWPSGKWWLTGRRGSPGALDGYPHLLDLLGRERYLRLIRLMGRE